MAYKHGVKAAILCFMLLSLGFLFGREVEVLVADADLEIPLEGALIRSWDGGGV